MKNLLALNRFFLFILLLGFFHSKCNAQTFSNKHNLVDDIESLLNSNPDQSLKVAQYLLSKTNTGNKEKAKANFLIARAYMIKGDYGSALNFLYEEKNYEDYLTEFEKIKVEIAKIDILREISLFEKSKEILDKLQDQFSNSHLDKNQKLFLEKSIAIEKAKFFLKEKKISEGIALLESQEFSSDNNSQEFKELRISYYTTIGNLYIEIKQLAKAESCFQTALKIINQEGDENIYLKIEVLSGLSQVSFLKNEHEKAVNYAEEAFGYAKRFDNLFLQVKLMQQKEKSYLALNNLEEYKNTNAKFFEVQTETEGREQETINMAYNLISNGYDNEYSDEKANYLKIVYIISALLLIVIIGCVFFWQKRVQHKNSLNEVVNYIEITRSNLLSSFSITDKKNEPKKNIILKETELHILNKLKRFENSKRFLSKDISLAVLAGQLESNTKYLSEIINTHYNVNFNTYINRLRINFIIEKLKTDPNFINYKISYLAESCGFSSHSSFATVFKSITGISPVKFIELLNQEKEDSLLKNNE
jgi:AraC-like DNA-binding protein